MHVSTTHVSSSYRLAAESGSDVMKDKLHKLAALRVLKEGMAKFEAVRQARLEAGQAQGEVDRETAQLALTCVVGFFVDHGIEAGPLRRVLGGLEALSAGSRAIEMLRPITAAHRPIDPPVVEEVKGRLAGIMAYLQTQGLPRRQAAQWVSKNLPPDLKPGLGQVSARAVDSWLAKWGGQYGTKGTGQEGYRHTLDILAVRKPPPNKSDLKNIMAALAKSALA
jgi:hypothetical protein